MTQATKQQIHQAPKAVLHDHLDCGLRPQTMIDIAAEVGHELPADNAQDLADWFYRECNSGSLVRYLEGFVHTAAVMQRGQDLERVAREAVEDLAADNVVYAELRWAPEQHLSAGLSLEETIEAVQRGIDAGVEAAAEAGRFIRVGQLITAMRQGHSGEAISRLAVTYRDRGVFGFDIAGPEDGFPPVLFQEAFDYLRTNNMHYTIHAGEAFGLPSIEQAVHWCIARRIGHGVRLVDDIDLSDPNHPVLGRLAAYIRDERIALEVAPTSNLQTGAAESIAKHPFDVFARLNFRVTVNTDNRLMSATSMSREMEILCEAFGYGIDDLRRFTINAMDSSFISYPERQHIIETVINPGYEALAD